MLASRRGKTENSTSSSIKCKVFDLCFLRLQWRGVRHEFLPQGRTFNKEYYLEVLCRLREANRLKRTELWKNQSWNLQHTNAPAHTSMLVREFLAKTKTVIMPQSLYSPVLALADFFLFSKTEDIDERKAFSYD